MKVENNDIILVTGCPRSGTTAVGSMLSKHPKNRSIYEPFNKTAGLLNVDREFEIPGIDGFSSSVIDSFMRDLKNKKLKYKKGFRDSDSRLKRFAKHFIGANGYWSNLKFKFDFFHEHVIWKDPLASFFLNHLTKEYPELKLVMVFKSPFGVAASFKRLGWYYKDIESIFRRVYQVNSQIDTIAPLIKDKRPAINGFALYFMIYSTAVKWYEEGVINSTIFFDSELAAKDNNKYLSLFEHLEIGEADRILAKIEKSHLGRTKSNSTGKTHDFNRDINFMLNYNKDLLSKEEYKIISQEGEHLWNRLRELSL